MNVAYLLTGGNVGNVEETLDAAMNAVGRHCGTVLMASAIYRTAAWGEENQAPFLNQCLKITTGCSASSLLQCILSIEQRLGRVRDKKYGPRVIDIDILLFGNAVINGPGLTIPHPELHNRRFALQCLADVAPEEIHPLLGKTVAELLAACTDPLAVQKLSAD